MLDLTTYVRVLAVALMMLAGTGAVSTPPRNHEQHQLHAAPTSSAEGVTITNVVRAPDRFVGNVMRDSITGRVWLLSFGPPANTIGSSTLYEMNPATGTVVWQRRMPFHGEFGAAAYADGFLYQVISHESTMYKVSVSDAIPNDGIVSTVKIPTHSDLGVRDDDVYRYPFVAFTAAVGGSSEGSVQLYAADRGELITVDTATGAPVKRIRTTKGLGSLTRATDANGAPVLLALFDPIDSAFRQETRRFMFRASHGLLPLETVRAEGNYGHPGQKTVTWVLLDPESGEVLASTSIESTRLNVGSVAFVKSERVPGTRYGKFVTFTTGDEGILTVEWTPQ